MNIRSVFLVSICLLLSSCLGMGGRSPAPVTVHGTQSGAGSAGVHNVSRGDTLYSISNRYRLPMRDLAVLNTLQPPFHLYEGQRLRLPPPQEYTVRTGETLYGISRLFGVDTSEVARLNNMRSPYTLRVGQVLRLPSVTRKASASSVAPKKPVVSLSSDARAPQTPVSNDTVVRPSQKPSLPSQKAPARSPSVMADNGVPVPQTKPKVTKVSKVYTRTPKRSSSLFMRPVRGRVLSNYGVKKNGLHNDGINIAAPRGTSVKAAENGVVVYTGNALKGSGNLILLRHDNQWMSAYAHLDKISVAKGQVIKRGGSIGTVGSTGSVSSPQLHFELRRGTSAMNPSKYVK
ncbi:MAG: peptidoglycan DD-metalloendopeptidase family protein [Alphaproteobacteria bacterium]